MICKGVINYNCLLEILIVEFVILEVVLEFWVRNLTVKRDNITNLMVIIKIRIYDRPRSRQGNQAGPVTKLN